MYSSKQTNPFHLQNRLKASDDTECQIGNDPINPEPAASNTDWGNTIQLTIKWILVLIFFLMILPIDKSDIRKIGASIGHFLKPVFSSVVNEARAESGMVSEYHELHSAENQIAVPLSNPGEAGQLKLNMVRGALHVSGYDGDEVIIRYEGTSTRTAEREETPDGLRRISGRSPGFETIENNNVVEIRNLTIWEKVEFNIFVPRNFSLKLSIVHGDTLFVENVTGDIEISQVSGGIALRDIGGSAIVNTVNGDIVTVFQSVDPDKPMSFSTITGKIDVSIPANARFTARMKSEFGDVFSDFDMDMRDDATPRMNTSQPFRIAINEWVVADINGGGPDYRFSSLRGNIYIRKK